MLNCTILYFVNIEWSKINCIVKINMFVNFCSLFVRHSNYWFSHNLEIPS